MTSHLTARYDATESWPDSVHAGLAVGFYLAACLLVSMLTKRIPRLRSSSSRTFLRVATFSIFVMSFLDVTMAYLMLFVVGPGTSAKSCVATLIACSTPYLLGKLCVYSFYTERVYVVYSSKLTPRWQSKVYQCGILSLLGSVGFLAAAAIRRRAYLGPASEGRCYVSVLRDAVIPFIVFDFIVTGVLCAMYSVRLYRSSFDNAKSIAIRSAVAAVCCMTATLTNLILHAIYQGREVSWVCLGACALDLFVTACTIYILTYSPQPDVPDVSYGLDSTRTPSYTTFSRAPTFFLPTSSSSSDLSQPPKARLGGGLLGGRNGSASSASTGGSVEGVVFRVGSDEEKGEKLIGGSGTDPRGKVSGFVRGLGFEDVDKQV